MAWTDKARKAARAARAAGKNVEDAKLSPKSPHEMTGKEYVASQKGKKVEHGYYNRAGQLQSDHYQHVASALQVGKPVPSHVIREYLPQLRNSGFREAIKARYPDIHESLAQDTLESFSTHLFTHDNLQPF